MYFLKSLTILFLACTATAYTPLRQRSVSTIPAEWTKPTPSPTAPSALHNAAAARLSARDSKSTFDFSVRSDQIVPMMDALADLSSHLAEDYDPLFHVKDRDDGPPFKCHCKCTLLGGCECSCGDRNEKFRDD